MWDKKLFLHKKVFKGAVSRDCLVFLTCLERLGLNKIRNCIMRKRDQERSHNVTGVHLLAKHFLHL